MKIIYISNCLSSKDNAAINSMFPKMPHNPAIKFHRLLIDGMVNNGIDNIYAFSYIPINNQISKKLYLRLQKSIENGVLYFPVPALNIPILKNVIDYIYCYFCISRILKKEKATIICDVLRPTTVNVALRCAKKNGCKCIGIVTDMPGKRANMHGAIRRLADKISQKQLLKFDGYVFITEQMNNLFNGSRKPYCVVECLADANLTNMSNLLKDKSYPKVCMYAGALRKIYGIENLVEGFLDAKLVNVELHIYGSGEDTQYIVEKANKYDNIKFFGVVPNDEILRFETQATLLINPRADKGEYTQYSFPSKNMEYMSSGTPLLATKLPGIPSEYYEHMIAMETGSSKEISRNLTELFHMPSDHLHNIGIKAKKFVIEEKNNTFFARRLIKLINAVNR